MTHDHDQRGITVESAGLAVVQDLGRAGHGDKGISANGASDRRSAQMATVLAGNAPGTPLLETAGSSTSLTFYADTLVAMTGATTEPRMAGTPVPTWDPFVVKAAPLSSCRHRARVGAPTWPSRVVSRATGSWAAWHRTRCSRWDAGSAAATGSS